VLSYRHGYHAGNHADVLKHLVLVALIEHYTQKAKPLWYIDTHAGAGVYALDRAPASLHKEHDDGIGRLWPAAGRSGLLGKYLELVGRLNPDGRLRKYPGSPWIARELLRPSDQLWFYDLHPAEYAALSRTFTQANVKIEQADGLSALRALLPPAPRRALVMIDPSYELKSDYEAVARALADALERFPNGTFAVWYPLLTSHRADPLLRRLGSLKCARWLHAVMQVGERANATPQLYGSGMFVVNPPHTLPAMLDIALQTVTRKLARDDSAQYRVEFELP
jgi:23S rRNA (adenine2030-N6)-methyltransferase